MAGLLGVGGGIIMVPALYYAFTVLNFDIVTRMHLAVGTAFFITIFTSTASVLTHRKHNAVDLSILKTFGLFVILGVFFGSFLAAILKTKYLVLFLKRILDANENRI